MATRNKIYAIVEGHGEANQPSPAEKPAVVVLINRLLRKLHCWTLFVPEKIPPFRLTYSQFFHADKFENAIRFHLKYLDCAALLVLLDMDDDCPKEKTFNLIARIRSMGVLPFSVVVVCAKCEYEAWFLASLESIHTGSLYRDDPEARRDAKRWLKKQFGYRQIRDQSSYTGKIDIDLACLRSRSFRRLCHAMEEIVTSVGDGQCIVTPSI
ncbi:hypothetical protein BH10CHL1_BH10CHL1_34720 [soil metagenome]